MARSTIHPPTRRKRRAAAPAPPAELARSGPSAVLDGMAVVAFGLAVGLGLVFYPEGRRGAVEALGYGWLPVALWVATALGTLRYYRWSLLRNWRRWVIAAALAALAVGILSFFRPGDGTLAEVSLGGRWGSLLGGEPLALGALKLAAIAILVPLLVYPRQLGRFYARRLRQIGMGLQFAALYVYLAGSHVTHFLGRRLRLLFNNRYRRRMMDRVRRFLLLVWPGKSGKSAGPAGPLPLEASAASKTAESSSLWNGSDPGTIPNMESAEPAADAEAEPERVVVPNGPASRWRLPPLDLMSPPEVHDPPEAPLEQMARHIESTLAEHGVMVEVKDVKAGPRIIRFGLVPGWVSRRGEGVRGEPASAKGERSRVKVQSILTREKDLALALKTPYLRIEAPVPGEALVGLEVPAPSPSKVHLRAVMESPPFRKIATKGGLPIALGQDAGGTSVTMDLAALPHVLIAGATGSGKSVCINSIVASLLLTKPPDQLRMLMVDPKRVELTPFNSIPHLIAPVIVEVDEVNPALRAVMREMFRRYKQMEEVGTRNITGYNAKARERMPYLVLIVDELADLMIAGGFEVEQNLVRLAQLGRATGIHLVLATQRPSVNVVTGLLKANIPARVAFAVASQVDSRVILDTVGAEKLLGKGDMLLLNSDSPKPRRVQGTLVYDKEIDHLVKFWVNQKGPPLPVIPLEDLDDEDQDGDEVDDQLVDRARELALRNPRLSTSLLERRLKIGGRRAAQIIELLEEEGLVIPR